MKFKLTISLLLLIFLLPVASYSQPGGMRQGRKDPRCLRALELDLSSEQAKSLDLLQQTFRRETQLLRAQLLTKRIELRELLTNPASNTESIRTKYLEAVEIQTRMEEKAFEYLVKIRALLTREQLKSWCPEQEFPFFHRLMPGHSPMGPRSPRKPHPPEE